MIFYFCVCACTLLVVVVVVATLIKAYEDWIQQAHNQNQQVTIEE